ncbi:MAG: F0F1 ATP synthase subunit B [Prolixibacteraceae bacterium]|jgi:F-type H+-transporting ATPase subunit b|nr:F0F1 ATP synthase subunit B [Prolixibacteraceae bacterium]
MELVTPGIGLLFWMGLSFTIVFLILKKFAWKPIMNALKERETSISEALNAAEKARKDVEGLKADNEKIIAEARREKELILKEARDIKEKIVTEAKTQANIEAQKSIETARVAIQNEKTAAINEIKQQVAELSVSIAEKVLQKELKDKKEQEALVENLLKDVKLQ